MSGNNIENVDDLRVYVTELSGLFVDLIVKLETVSFSLNDPRLLEAYNQTYEANILNDIRWNLYLDLIKDSYSIIGDARADSFNLATAIRCLEIQDIVKELKSDFCKPIECERINPEAFDEHTEELLKKMAAKEEIAKASEFDENIAEIKETNSRLQGGHIRGRIYNCRNRVIAHKGFRRVNGRIAIEEIKPYGLKVGDTEKFIKMGEELMHLLGVTVCSTDFGFSSTHYVYAKQSKAFWDTCVGPNRNK